MACLRLEVESAEPKQTRAVAIEQSVCTASSSAPCRMMEVTSHAAPLCWGDELAGWSCRWWGM